MADKAEAGRAEPGAAPTGRAEPGAGLDAQKPYYSGNKKSHTPKCHTLKCHTLKSQITVAIEGMIRAVSGSVPGGANHDLTLPRDSHLLDPLQDDEAALTDKGYVGIRTRATSASETAPPTGGCICPPRQVGGIL